MATPTRRTGPPDFIGVGAQRCGTTWWFRVLVDHPEIRAPRRRRKEQHFFDRFCGREMADSAIERYHDLFPRRRGQIAGEWTPRYMRDLWAPPLLKRAAPKAKLLVLLRDPVERYRSGVLHMLTRRQKHAPEALAADAIERGCYASQLERLRVFFADEQILVLQYEKCRAEPLEQYRRTLRFLGVAEDHRPAEMTRRRGTTMEARKEPLWPDLKRALQQALERDVAHLHDLVPDLDLSLWPNFSYLAEAHGPERRVRSRSGST
jgi:hypothetical protein